MKNLILAFALLSLPSVALAGAARPGGDKAISVDESNSLQWDDVYMQNKVMETDPAKRQAMAADEAALHAAKNAASLAKTRTEYLGKLADYREERDHICAAYGNPCVAFPATFQQSR